MRRKHVLNLNPGDRFRPDPGQPEYEVVRPTPTRYMARPTAGTDRALVTLVSLMGTQGLFVIPTRVDGEVPTDDAAP